MSENNHTTNNDSSDNNNPIVNVETKPLKPKTEYSSKDKKVKE